MTRRSVWLAAGGGAIAGALVTLLLVAPQLGGPAQPAPAPSAETSATPAPGADGPRFDGLFERDPGSVTAIGDPAAPVVMVEFADYRCPYCALFSRDTLPALIADYVDAGVLRVEWRDAPIFGEESIGAAVAARAAGEQGLFWEYNEAIYAGAPEKGHAELPRERLIAIAGEIGVADLAAFEAALDSAELRERVLADQAVASGIGVSSVPAFVINDEAFAGAQPLDVFRRVIDEQLHAATQ